MLVAMTNIVVKLFILGIVGKNTFAQVKQQQSIHKSVRCNETNDVTITFVENY